MKSKITKKIVISHPVVSPEAIRKVVKVLKSGYLAQGEQVGLLEEGLAKYCGVKHVIAVNSGTAAIHCALYGIGLDAGDEVITSPFTFAASANPIILMGAKVVFADIKEDDFCLDPEQVRKKISEKTKAILPVDLYGQPADYSHLRFSPKIKILADACQSIGAGIGKKKTGALGDVAAFSFYATKNVMCGEGGAVMTNSDQIAQRCLMFRNHGQDQVRRYYHKDIGLNYRMTDVLAAILIDQIDRIDQITKMRNERAARYLLGLAGILGIVTPATRPKVTHAFHQYTIRVLPDFPLSRDQLKLELERNDIYPMIYYPAPLYFNPSFAQRGYKGSKFPVAEKVAKEVLSLPVHPGVTLTQIDFICKTIRRVYARKTKS